MAEEVLEGEILEIEKKVLRCDYCMKKECILKKTKCPKCKKLKVVPSVYGVCEECFDKIVEG